MSQGLVMKDGCLAELQDLEWLKVEACSLQQAPNISDVAFSLQGLRKVSENSGIVIYSKFLLFWWLIK